ncbi:hypothetical protein M405DRAFT_839180 [Rhizopogon salebrosus TDB-379]|nr:hypothetical protein M405DRAFT_839180 [Rhizopogon salebrosus TDB-379]
MSAAAQSMTAEVTNQHLVNALEELEVQVGKALHLQNFPDDAAALESCLDIGRDVAYTLQILFSTYAPVVTVVPPRLLSMAVEIFMCQANTQHLVHPPDWTRNWIHHQYFKGHRLYSKTLSYRGIPVTNPGQQPVNAMLQQAGPVPGNAHLPAAPLPPTAAAAPANPHATATATAPVPVPVPATTPLPVPAPATATVPTQVSAPAMKHVPVPPRVQPGQAALSVDAGRQDVISTPPQAGPSRKRTFSGSSSAKESGCTSPKKHKFKVSQKSKSLTFKVSPKDKLSTHTKRVTRSKSKQPAKSKQMAKLKEIITDTDNADEDMDELPAIDAAAKVVPPHTLPEIIVQKKKASHSGMLLMPSNLEQQPLMTRNVKTSGRMLRMLRMAMKAARQDIISFLIAIYIIYNLYVLPAGKPFTGVGTGLSIQYLQKNPYPLHGYGFLPGTGAAVDVVMDDHTGTTSVTGSIVVAAAAASAEAGAGAARHAADVDMGPVPMTDTAEEMSLENMSFTVRPMEADAAEFAEAGFSSADDFATAGDFESGHFEDPAEEEELAQHTVAHQTTPPTNASINGIIAAMRHQIQVLRAGDCEEIQRIRTNTCLNYAETRVQDLEVMYAKLSVEQDDNKIVLNNLVNGMADFVRYFTDVQLSGPDRHYTNPPSIRQLAQEILPDIFSNLSSCAPTGPGNFDSASHAGPSQTPISHHPASNILPCTRRTASNILPRTRRMASNILPQTKQISGTQRAKLPHAASAMVTRAQSSQKGKGKEKAQDDEDYIVDDPDAEGEEDEDTENTEWEDE